ncbi:hypothetical protein [Pseudomonas sp. RIT411]|uniref:hypothetical protein n=1 Tax=Pseudomonas sp. RIT411 TaxID=2202160 RepID=UPI000D3C577A|nr:hypothetical protein [Pseudomonas sp. RIT 411]RAU40147.1 hypothetical protein DBY63_010135 [Pseudomonas sp. RIT 411]
MEQVDEFGSFGGDDFDPDCLEMIRNQRDLYVEEIAIMRGIMSRLRQNLLTVLTERDQLWAEVRIVRGFNQLSVQNWMAGGGDGAPAPQLEEIDVKYHELLLAVNICQKESEHLRQELATARAMAIDEKMDADRLRSQVSWLQGKR